MSSFSCNKLFNGVYHILQFLLGHAWINTQPEAVGHNMVCHWQITDNTVVLAFLILLKSRMFKQITSEEISRLVL